MDAPAPAPVPPFPPAPPAAPVAASTYGAVPAAWSAPESPYAVAPGAWGQPVPRQNVLAWVAFGLGLGGVFFGLVTSVAAIVCGHIARRQIRERGEQGGAAALVGLIAGYVLTAIILLVIGLYVLLLLFVVAGAGASSSFGSSI